MSSSSSSVPSIMSSATASKTTKVAKKTAAPETVVAAPVVAAPVAVATKTKKAAAAPVVATPVVATPVVATPVATTEGVVAAEEPRLEMEAKSITAALLAVRETVSVLITEAKKLEKKAAKVQKLADKRRRRKAPVEGEEAKPARISIFQIPTNISPALCAFMGRPAGSQESRSNVTKFITTYVKEKNLKDKHDIKGDAALLKLLNLKAEDKLTYFNLQKYLNVHYLKAAPTTA
jgi:hypothetical protein